jgi:hypothetical protein
LRANLAYFSLDGIYTGIAEDTAGELKFGFSCSPGSAFTGTKMWATSSDEATDMMQSIGRDIGFAVTGRIQIYDSEPAEPPGESPHGYDIQFTPFRPEDTE